MRGSGAADTRACDAALRAMPDPNLIAVASPVRQVVQFPSPRHRGARERSVAAPVLNDCLRKRARGAIEGLRLVPSPRHRREKVAGRPDEGRAPVERPCAARGACGTARRTRRAPSPALSGTLSPHAGRGEETSWLRR
jgi:hypothetical protein